MRMIRILSAVFGLLGVVAFAQAAALQKGLHYDLIDPAQPTEVPGKVEVIEFFSYGCPHCYDFEPALTQWIKKLPKDVNFYRVPFAREQWAVTAKLFYTLDAMGVEEKLHDDVFKSIHEDKSLNAFDEAGMTAWAVKKGLDAKKFSDTYKSFAIQTKVQHALQMAATHKISGVPMIVVDGRYLVLKNTIQSFDDLLALTDQVIDMARPNRK
jgi:thiol:disulfide interchange protein DsbA